MASKNMIEIAQLDPDIFVSRQLAESDFAELAARGFRAVISNRPDGESPGQLASRGAEALARRHGLEFRHLPVQGANITDADVVDAFARLIDDLPGPILCYCGTGTRSASLWTQVAAARLGIGYALQMASKAGHDLEILRDDLIEQASTRMRRSSHHAGEPAAL